MKLAHRFTAIAAMLVWASSAVAQTPVALPTDVETVVSGGRWQADTRTGTYRVVVRSSGFEHVVSQVQVDWVSDAAGAESYAAVVASEVASTGAWRIGRTRIVEKGKQWVAVLEGVEPHFTPLKRGTWEVTMGSPGKLNAVLKER